MSAKILGTGVCVKWPLMMVNILFTFCCNNYWKSKFTAMEKPGKLREFFSPTLWSPSVLWFCWLGGRKDIRPVKTERWMLALLSVWSEVQTCIWPSWYHCRSLSRASVKSRLVLPFWYRLTWVVPDKGPLSGCMCVRGHVGVTLSADVVN